MAANGRFLSAKDVINNHPRIQQMKEWVTRNREYDRVTQKTSLAADPYSYMDRGREQREFLQLRDDLNRDYRKKEPMNQYIDGRLQREIPEEEPIVESDSYIKKLSKKLKIRW